MPLGAGPAALAGRLRLPLLRPSGALRAGGNRGLYQCNRCKKQTSPTAGTIFHATKLPQTLWFAAIHLIVTAKNGISSVDLGRRLGVKQPTAWAVKHKIMAVMARREGETALTGRVEMDDAYLGLGVLRRQAGPRRGGQNALRGGGLDQSRGAQAEAGTRQVASARTRSRTVLSKHWLAAGVGGCDGRPWLLVRRTSNEADRLSLDPAMLVGGHAVPKQAALAVRWVRFDARQHQERDHRGLISSSRLPIVPMDRPA